MTERRQSPRIFRRAFLAAAGLCLLSGTALADPPPSREYPPTYSSRKAPWYDPFRLFKSSEKTSTPVAPPKMSQPMPATSMTVPPPPAPVLHAPVQSGSSQDWKWYGYGGPTPGNNHVGPIPAAPRNNEWPSQIVPDSMPLKNPISAMPSPIVEPPPVKMPDGGPALPSPSPIAAKDIEWKTSAAHLRPPTHEESAPSTGAPLATLKAPVAAEIPAAPATPSRPFTPRTPAEAVRGPGVPAPDIKVVPAPGIIMPGSK